MGKGRNSSLPLDTYNITRYHIYMKNRYVGIDKFVGLDGTTTYFVMEVNDNKSKIVYRSSSKNGAYQVAHKYARLNVIPLYETVYNALVS